MQELYSHKYSIVHHLDARVKLVFTLVFLICLNLTPSAAWPAYILFFAVLLSAVLAARLKPSLLFKRSLVAFPFMLAAIPLLFTGAAPHFSLHIGSTQLLISLSGMARFSSIAIKMWLSVLAAVLLGASTRFTDLSNALLQMKAPRLLVAIITLMWRYLFVIVEEVTRMLRARSSRSASTPGKRFHGGSIWWRARVTGGMAGSLFLRALERSDRVYTAMLSRGYSGDLPAGQIFPIPASQKRLLLPGILTLVIFLIIGTLTGG
jgi:cobalt/nickel transport system permease protein